MDSNILASIIGIGGTLLGTWVGSKYSYRGAMDAVTKQMDFQANQLENEKKYQSELAIRIISKLLWPEISSNYKKIEHYREYLDVDDFIENNKAKICLSRDLDLTTYNKIKYDLVKHNSEIINDVIDVYNAIYILSQYDQLGDIKKEEFESVRKIFDKIENIQKYIMKS